MSIDLSLIIPCLNEAGHLERNVAAIEAILAATRYSYELIFIDEVSEDETRQVIERIVAAAEARGIACRKIFHADRLGRGGTVKEGLRLARGRMAGFLDIDLEVSEAYLPSCLAVLDRGEADVVTVKRHYSLKFNLRSLIRHIVSAGYKRLVQSLINLFDLDTESGYKFFNREKILPVIDLSEHDGWFWDTEVMALAWLRGLTIRELDGLFLRNRDKQSTVRVVTDSIAYWKDLRSFVRRHGADLAGSGQSSPGLVYRHPWLYRLVMGRKVSQ